MLWKDKKQSLWGELTHKKYAGLTINDHLSPMGAIIARNGVNQRRRKIQQHTTHPFVNAESVQQQTCDNCTNHYLTIVPPTSRGRLAGMKDVEFTFLLYSILHPYYTQHFPLLKCFNVIQR